MRFQLMSDWPASQEVLEAGTIIDGNSPRWKGVVMPLTVRCLDQAAADEMVGWYPHLTEIIHQLPVRHAAGVIPVTEAGLTRNHGGIKNGN
jgi:hypothetical protein